MEFDKLNKASEKKVLFQMCFIPIRDAGAMGMRKDDMECYRDFWKAIADPNEIPFLDLSPAFATLSDSFWPIDETDNGQHFNANGQFLFAYILEHELVTRELIPFTPEKGSHRTFPPTHGTIPPGKKIEERN